MDLRAFKRQCLAHADAGNCTLAVSSSGIGKSDVIEQIFCQLKTEGAARGENWGWNQIFAATQTPPDLIGYQYKGEKIFGTNKDGSPRSITVTDASCPLWYLSKPHWDDPGGKPAYMYDKFFLFIDEYGQGDPDTKKGLAEIALKGGTAPYYLPPGSVRVMATNHGSRYGVTKDFDFAITRRVVLPINGDVDIWIEDFADRPYKLHGKQWQTMPVTKGWARTHPGILFEAEPTEQGPWCNPRALCAADRFLQTMWRNRPQEVDPETMTSLAGTIGMPATQSFVSHLQFRLELPSYASVVADPDNTPVPSRIDLQMLMAYELAGVTKVDDLAPVIKYIQRMPKDFGVTFISALLRKDYKGTINTPAMQAWINKNAALVAIVSSLSQ